MSTVATAALLVAIGLLVLAAAACGAQMTQVKDARVRRLARLYLDPLSTWCMAAVVVHALAVVAAGDVVALKLVLPIGVGVAAFLLRWADEPDEAPQSAESAPSRAAGAPSPGAGPWGARRAAAAPSAAAAAPADSPSPAAPVRPATGSLWSRGT